MDMKKSSSSLAALIVPLAGKGTSLGSRALEGDRIRLVRLLAGCGQAHAEQGSATATKTGPLLRERSSKLRSNASIAPRGWSPVPEPVQYDYTPGESEMDPTLRKGYTPSQITRSRSDAMAAGVFSGLGHYFGVDPTWLRIAYAVGTVFTAIIPGIALYAILAFIIPADTAREDSSNLA